VRVEAKNLGECVLSKGEKRSEVKSFSSHGTFFAAFSFFFSHSSTPHRTRTEHNNNKHTAMAAAAVPQAVPGAALHALQFRVRKTPGFPLFLFLFVFSITPKY
jgi:hypothetical protein